MNAKLKLPYALVDQTVELKRDGLFDADIIVAIGVHQATFYRWLKEGGNAKTGVKRALYEELKKAEAQYKRCLLATIKSAAESRAQYWTAAAWLLERKYPMEYGKMERKAEEAKNAPVQLTSVSSSSPWPTTPTAREAASSQNPQSTVAPTHAEKTALTHGLTPVSASRLTVVGPSVPLPSTGTTRSSAVETSSGPHTSDA